MDDLIWRQDAIDAIKLTSSPYLVELNETYQAQVKALKELPSAQQWIPCSERLPEKDGKYLITGRQGAVNILKFEDGRWYGKWGVLAWRPLPSPYREEAHDV